MHVCVICMYLHMTSLTIRCVHNLYCIYVLYVCKISIEFMYSLIRMYEVHVCVYDAWQADLEGVQPDGRGPCESARM
jgi:hypothetical protein